MIKTNLNKLRYVKLDYYAALVTVKSYFVTSHCYKLLFYLSILQF